MHIDDVRSMQQRFNKRFDKFGRTAKTLDWDKGKQEIRFEILTSQYSFEGKSVIDVGCGFGDLIPTLKEKASNFKYMGIDIVDVFIEEAQGLYTDSNYSFVVADFIEHDFVETFDYCIASGVFNYRLKQDNYDFIFDAMHKAWDICRDGFAFDFLSDKVDYEIDHAFHSSPCKILEFAYSLSKNVILRNDYMPFEFSLFMFKDDSFAQEDTLFTTYKLKNTTNNKSIKSFL